MIAFQVGGRATRDTLFLSSYSPAELPRMMFAAAAVSLLAAIVVAKAMTRWGPARLVPALFATSAALLMLEFASLGVVHNSAVVLFYLHFSALGAILVSSFFSLLNERFDPRAAKRAIGRIGAAGTVGGMVGGLLAGTTAMLSMGAMLPMLAILHLLCGALVLRIGSESSSARPAAATPGAGPMRTLTHSPYLLTVAAVVLLAAVSEGLFDQVFKTAMKDSYPEAKELARVFALFYATTNVLGIALTFGLGRLALERLGLARTVSILPWTVAVGGAAAIISPTFLSKMLAKGSENVVRNSFFRSGYELLFTPVPPNEKRAVKALLDVGAVRIGDIVASLLAQSALVIFATSAMNASRAMLMIAFACAAAAILLTLTIQGGYVATLERNLLNRAVQLELRDITDSTTRDTLMRTALPALPPHVAAAVPPGSLPTSRAAPGDPVVARLAELRSLDPARVREALQAPLAADHVAHVIELLAWDEVARAAGDALAGAAARHTGQLVDALLDPETDFTIRRRVSAPLAQARSQRAAEGLFAGLHDARFEVRFRCGRALARLTSNTAGLVIPPDGTWAAVLRELDVDRRVWESQRLLERTDDDPLQLGDAVRERASRSLEHVFTMLALVLPRKPLQIAFRGLFADDPQLRGTALEYLETALPPAVRDKIWPLLGDSPPRRKVERPLEQVVGDLIKSNDSIVIDLQASRRRPAPG